MPRANVGRFLVQQARKGKRLYRLEKLDENDLLTPVLKTPERWTAAFKSKSIDSHDYTASYKGLKYSAFAQTLLAPPRQTYSSKVTVPRDLLQPMAVLQNNVDPECKQPYILLPFIGQPKYNELRFYYPLSSKLLQNIEAQVKNGELPKTLHCTRPNSNVPRSAKVGWSSKTLKVVKQIHADRIRAAFESLKDTKLDNSVKVAGLSFEPDPSARTITFTKGIPTYHLPTILNDQPVLLQEITAHYQRGKPTRYLGRAPETTEFFKVLYIYSLLGDYTL